MTSERRLSRSGVKETTLDYTRDFAERRGIAEQMGVRSEIEIPAEHAGLRPDRSRRPSGTPASGSGSRTVRRDPRKKSAEISRRIFVQIRARIRRRSATAPQSVRGPETRRGAAVEGRSRIAPARTACRSTRNGRSRPRSSGAACSPASAQCAFCARRSAQSGRKGRGACGRRRRPTGWPSGASPLEQAVDRRRSVDRPARREGCRLDMQLAEAAAGQRSPGAGRHEI